MKEPRQQALCEGREAMTITSGKKTQKSVASRDGLGSKHAEMSTDQPHL